MSDPPFPHNSRSFSECAGCTPSTRVMMKYQSTKVFPRRTHQPRDKKITPTPIKHPKEVQQHNTHRTEHVNFQSRLQPPPVCSKCLGARCWFLSAKRPAKSCGQGWGDFPLVFRQNNKCKYEILWMDAILHNPNQQMTLNMFELFGPLLYYENEECKFAQLNIIQGGLWKTIQKKDSVVRVNPTPKNMAGW